MQAFDLSPLFRSTVGFDRLTRLLDSATRVDDSAFSYPPYTIEQTGDDSYRIVMAVAGFSEAELRRLQAMFKERAIDDSPFDGVVRVKGAHWVRPDLVAAVSFTEWTRDGKLRHPRYQGLRTDKAANEVRRESRPA